MQLTIAGTGTAAPGRPCSGYWVETPESRILMDCGPGVVHSLAQLKLPWARMTHLLLTHFHNDHTGDVPFLFFALHYGLEKPRKEPLTVIGPRGTKRLFEQLGKAFGNHIRRPKFPVDVTELDGAGVLQLPGVTLRAHATPHTDASLAYRLEDGQRAIGYTGDTGPSAELGAFMRGVDVLIAECSMPEGDVIPSHLSPERLAHLASAASPGLLVATHVYPSLERAGLPEAIRKAGWEGEFVVAEEGLRLNCRPLNSLHPSGG